MSKFKEPDFRKQLSTIFIKLAEKIEHDEQFAAWLFEGTALAGAEKSPKRKKMSIAGQNPSSTTADSSSFPDIFTIYLRDGGEALQQQLNQYELELLKKVVTLNGLDPTGKVRKWKTKHKVIAFIIESVSKQMSKGKAFLN